MSNERDNFFKARPDAELTDRILKSARVELDLNKSRTKQNRWFVFIVPVFTALAASFIAFKIFIPVENNQNKNLPSGSQTVSALSIDYFLNDEEQVDLAESVIEDEEVIEMAEELSFLQEFDEIEELNDEELEG